MVNKSACTAPCLWKKVLLNKGSTSSKDTNPVQTQKCINCEGTHSGSCKQECNHFLPNLTQA